MIDYTIDVNGIELFIARGYFTIDGDEVYFKEFNSFEEAIKLTDDTPKLVRYVPNITKDYSTEVYTYLLNYSDLSGYITVCGKQTWDNLDMEYTCIEYNLNGIHNVYSTLDYNSNEYSLQERKTLITDEDLNTFIYTEIEVYTQAIIHYLSSNFMWGDYSYPIDELRTAIKVAVPTSEYCDPNKLSEYGRSYHINRIAYIMQDDQMLSLPVIIDEQSLLDEVTHCNALQDGNHRIASKILLRDPVTTVMYSGTQAGAKILTLGL